MINLSKTSLIPAPQICGAGKIKDLADFGTLVKLMNQLWCQTSTTAFKNTFKFNTEHANGRSKTQVIPLLTYH